MYEEAEQASLFDPDTWSGKTSPEPSAAENPKARTLQRSSKKSSKSQNPMPMCVSCRRTADGQNPAVITIAMEDGALLGEYTMHSFGECPREENVSRLSQILEASPHPKYSLSAKACQGILNRAERRGKKLPEALERALRAQSASKNEQDAQGGGKGILIQPERTGALSTLNNQSVFCLQGNGIDRADTAGCNGKGWREDVSYTLNTIDRPAVAPIPINTMLATRDKALGRGTGFGVGCEGDAQFTLSAAHCHAVMCLNDQGGSIMSVSEDVSGCLRAQEHGHQPIVAGFKDRAGAQAGSVGYQEEQSPTILAEMIPSVINTYQQVTGPLMANSHPGSYCGQDAYQDMLVAGLDCRNGRENGDLCGTLQSKPNGGFSYNCIHPVRCNNIVRRLTPLECERLQGYPDGWTDIGEWTDSKGKRHKEADSPRYKALGNSIALPFWKWMLKRISAQYERDAILGSLFDGIGGFPLCWEQINGKGTARWASEIEEFPIAVTKIRFPEE